MIQINLSLIILTKMKVDQIIYNQCAQQTLRPVVSAKKTGDVPVDPDKIKSYTVSMSMMY